jgi:hypothetical protein
MNRLMKRVVRSAVVVSLCLVLASCEEPRVYGSVGFSSYNGSWGGGGVGTSVTIGGRIR